MRSQLAVLLLAAVTYLIGRPVYADVLKVTARDADGGYPEVVCIYGDKTGRLTEPNVTLDALLVAADAKLKTGRLTEPGVTLDPLLAAANAKLTSDKLRCQCNSSIGGCKDIERLPARLEKVLFIQIFPAPARIERVSLDGPQLHINATFASSPAWLVSRSKSYLPASALVSRKDQVLGSFVDLPLESTHLSLALPEADLANEQFESVLAVKDKAVSGQSQSPGGKVNFTLPVDGMTSGEPVPLTIKVRSKAKPRSIVAQYEALLPNQQRVVPVSIQRFIFRWRASECLYQPHRVDDCPSASIPEHGIECTPKFEVATQSCFYYCSHAEQFDIEQRRPDKLSSFQIPTKVRMSIGVQGDTWFEHVVRLNQLVSGGPSRDTRRLAVLFPWEAAPLVAPKPAVQELVHADLFAPDGKAFRIEAAAGNQKVTVPGATCNDPLTYRYWGRWQSFDSGQVPLDDKGRYVLPDPKSTFHENWIAGHLSLSFSSASFDLETPIHPALDVEVAPQWRWFESRHILELTIGYELGMRDYVLESASDETRAPKVDLTHRFSLGGRWMYSLCSEAFWAGIGVGARESWVVDERDRKHIDSPATNFYVAPTIRIVPTRALSLQLASRISSNEKVRFFEGGTSSNYQEKSKLGLEFMGGIGVLLPI